jgi:hypothetical protein
LENGSFDLGRHLSYNHGCPLAIVALHCGLSATAKNLVSDALRRTDYGIYRTAFFDKNVWELVEKVNFPLIIKHLV